MFLFVQRLRASGLQHCDYKKYCEEYLFHNVRLRCYWIVYRSLSQIRTCFHSWVSLVTLITLYAQSISFENGRKNKKGYKTSDAEPCKKIPHQWIKSECMLSGNVSIHDLLIGF